MDRTDKIQQLELIEEHKRRKSRRKIYEMYPDKGPHRRELYHKHMSFFRAGAEYRERLMLAANRVGKTEGVGLYELVWHAMGEYPSWWEGRRFKRPIRAWVAGDTGKTVREILQMKLLGPIDAIGTGVLPGDAIMRTTKAAGVSEGIDSVYVKNKYGGTSIITFKSYEQGRVSFQGTEMDIILLDEEPPVDVYLECLMRTMTNKGMIMLTFTPLSGMSEVVLAFLPNGEFKEAEGTKFVVMATWDDAPHLTEESKQQLYAALPPYQREARSKGVPQLGSGAIYAIAEQDVQYEDFEIPAHWPRVYGLDVGWNKTAAVWGAWDRETDVVYLYGEYYRGQAEPEVHTAGIKAKGSWIHGVIDPASRGRSQKDGTKLLDEYMNQGLLLQPADNAVEAGIYTVFTRLTTGKLKISKTLGNFWSEYRLYRRDEKGKVVKSMDHLMDAMRYLIASGLSYATCEPVLKATGTNGPKIYSLTNEQTWMR